MKRLYTLFIILVYPLFLLTAWGQTDDVRQKKDSLQGLIRTLRGEALLEVYNELKEYIFYYEHDIESIIRFFDQYEKEARKQNNLDFEKNARESLLLKLFQEYQHNQVIARAPKDIDFFYKNQQWKSYCKVHKGYILSLFHAGKQEEALLVAQNFYEQSQQIAYPDAVLYALHFLGLLHIEMGKREEALNFFTEAINEAKKSPAVTEIRIDAYFYAVQSLIVLRRFDEAEQLLKQWDADLKKMEQQDEEETALSLKANLYRMYIRLYQNKEDYDLMEKYCDKLEALNFNSPNVQMALSVNRTAIYQRRGDYENALEATNKGLAVAEETGILRHIRNFSKTRAKLLHTLKRPDEVVETYERILVLTDSIYSIEIQKQLDEIRTQYEVDKHIAEKERNRNYFLFALGGCLLLAIVLGIWIYYSRTIIKKNRGLYLQIKEQDRLAEELDAMTKQYEQIPQFVTSTNKDAENAQLSGNKQQRQLVSQLREFLLKDRYFAIADIDINEIASQMASNRTSLFGALKTVAEKTPMEYINYLRLDEAKHLLENSDITIETIAFECGFNTARTFYRQFRERYRITPADYRKMAKN